MSLPKIKLFKTNEIGRRGPTFPAILIFIILPCVALFVYINLNLGGNKEKEASIKEAPPVVKMQNTLKASQKGSDEIGPRAGTAEGSVLGSTRKGEVMRFSPQDESEIGGTTLNDLMAAGARTGQESGKIEVPSDDPLSSILRENNQRETSTEKERELEVIFGVNNKAGEEGGQSQRRAGVLKFDFSETPKSEEKEELDNQQSPVRYTPDQFLDQQKAPENKYLPIGYKVPVTIVTPVRSYEQPMNPLVRMQVNKGVKFMGKTVIPYGAMILASMQSEQHIYGDARISLSPRFILYPDGSTTPIQGAMRSEDDTYGVQGYLVGVAPEKHMKDLAAPIAVLQIAEKLKTTESSNGTTSTANDQLSTWAVQLLQEKSDEIDQRFIPQHVYIPAGTRCYIELTGAIDMSIKQPPVGDGSNSQPTQHTNPLVSAAQATPTGQLAVGGTEMIMQLLKENPELFADAESTEEVQAIIRNLMGSPVGK